MLERYGGRAELCLWCMLPTTTVRVKCLDNNNHLFATTLTTSPHLARTLTNCTILSRGHVAYSVGESASLKLLPLAAAVAPSTVYAPRRFRRVKSSQSGHA